MTPLRHVIVCRRSLRHSIGYKALDTAYIQQFKDGLYAAQATRSEGPNSALQVRVSQSAFVRLNLSIRNTHAKPNANG